MSDLFHEGYFHTCQYLFTAHFRKMLSFEMHFLSNFWFQYVFQQLLKHIQEKNGPFILFWFCDSRVIIVTYLPSYESADSEFYFTTDGNVVRGDRTVMQMKSLGDHPDMSYGSSKQWKQLCEKYCFNCFLPFWSLI